jgi:hypothetical protein
MSLGITYAEIRRNVGRLLGFGADPDTFDPSSVLAVDDAIRAGLRDFYWPSVNGAPYDWSFLRKTATISLVSGTATYALPSDFVRISSALTVAGGNYPLSQISSSGLRTLGHTASESGDPVYFAISIDGTNLLLGDTRYQLGLYPVPDASSVLTYGYVFSPTVNLNTGSPLGGVNHSAAIVECCLARAELAMNLESLNQTGGIHLGRAERMLAISIESDRNLQSTSSPVSQTQQSIQQGQ